MKKLLLLASFITIATFCHAQRRHYGGGHHTASHGGHYNGGSGSSHRGGHYHNPSSYNRYGTHKRH